MLPWVRLCCAHAGSSASWVATPGGAVFPRTGPARQVRGLSFGDEHGRVPMKGFLRLDEDLRRLLEARHHDPFAVLGRHDGEGGTLVRIFIPQAEEVSIVEGGGGSLAWGTVTSSSGGGTVGICRVITGWPGGTASTSTTSPTTPTPSCRSSRISICTSSTRAGIGTPSGSWAPMKRWWTAWPACSSRYGPPTLNA